MGMFYGHNQPTAIIPPVIAASNGYLYNGYTVDGNASNLINGLHVPSETEFTTLATYLGGTSVAGGKLKETGLTHWLTPNTGASDLYDFTMLPSGARSSSFILKGESGYLWTDLRTYVFFGRYTAAMSGFFSGGFTTGYSIRCVRTLTAQEQIDFNDGDIVEVATDYDYNGYNVVRIGTQGWSVGNLKTTHYLDGTPLTKVEGVTWSSLTTEGYCAYDNDEGNV